MRLTKQLKEYLQGFDFYNTFEVANTIADYVEKKHKDNREIKDEYWKLAEKYIKEEEMYLEDELRTRKRSEEGREYLRGLLEKTYKKFGLTGKEILEYARTRDDLGVYEDDYLLERVDEYYRYGTIEDCLDEFSHFYY